MGRNIPLGEVHPIHHPLVYFSFMIACISATVAIFSSLCGSFSKKKSPPPPPPPTSSNTPNNNENTFVGTTSLKETSPRYDASFKRNSTDQSQVQGEESIFLQQPLPPPPSMRANSSNNSHLRANSMGPATHSRSNSNSSQGRLSGSVSMRFGSSLGSRQSSRREDPNYEKKRDKKSNKDEDSIWKKQIILGEKCKVPADEDDDTILYDEDGNRISAYHPKPPNGLAISRQSSNIEEDAIPK